VTFETDDNYSIQFDLIGNEKNTIRTALLIMALMVKLDSSQF